MTAELALIGAGAMGGAIGARFRATGHLLRVFDLDSARVATLTAQGAVAAGSAAEAARQAQAVILSLNSARIVEAAVFGPAGVAEGAAAGTLIIDMSSIDPAATRDLAQRAAEAGLGIALIPDFMLGDALTAGRLAEVLPARPHAPVGVHAVYPQGRFPQPKLRACASRSCLAAAVAPSTAGPPGRASSRSRGGASVTRPPRR